MRKTIIILIVLFTASLSFAQKANDDLGGVWKTPEGSFIYMSKTNGVFTGRYKDKEGVVLKDILLVHGKWKGKIGDPNKGKYYDCEVSTKEPNKLIIVAKSGIFRRTITWLKTS